MENPPCDCQKDRVEHFFGVRVLGEKFWGLQGSKGDRTAGFDSSEADRIIEQVPTTQGRKNPRSRGQQKKDLLRNRQP